MTRLSGPLHPVDRRLGWIVMVCGVLAALAAWQRIVEQTPQFSAAWTALAFIPVALFLLGALRGRRLPAPLLRGMWAGAIVVQFVVQSTTFLGFRGTDPDALRAWVWVIEPAVVCLLPLLVRTRRAIALAIVFTVTPVLSGLVFLGVVPHMAMAMTPIHLGNVAVMAVVIGLRSRLLRLSDDEARTRGIETQREDAERGARRQREVARVVHDEVLSALRAAIRLNGESRPELRDAAARGLVALRSAARLPRVPGTAHTELQVQKAFESLVGVVGDAASPGGLRIADKGGTIPAEVIVGSSGALAEALRNSLAHGAPADSITVSGEVGADEVRLIVHDSGPGFDGTLVGRERLGVRSSIVGRMTDIPGGRAEVVSGPRGTRVEMGWRRVDDTIDAGLSNRIARIALVFMWATGIAHGVVVGRFPVVDLPLGVATYAVALLGALLVASGGRGRLSRTASIASVVCAVAITLSVLAYADVFAAPAGEVWLITFASYLCGVLAARGNLRSGAIGAALIVALTVLWGVLTHRDALGIAGMVTPTAVALLVGCTWWVGVAIITRRTRSAFDAAVRALGGMAAAVGSWRESRHDVSEIRRTAEPLLRRLVAGERVDEEFARELEVGEGSVRDRIRAPMLHHPHLRAAIDAARYRGARVLLLGDLDEEERGDERMRAEVADAIAGIIDDPDVTDVTITSLRGARRRLSMLVERRDESRDRMIVDELGSVLPARVAGAAPQTSGQISGT